MSAASELQIGTTRDWFSRTPTADRYSNRAQPWGLKRALRETGLPKIRVHDLRHTAASALLQAGVHPKVVQDMLGHSSITTTMDTYSHVMPTIHDDAVRRLDSILENRRHGAPLGQRDLSIGEHGPELELASERLNVAAESR